MGYESLLTTSSPHALTVTMNRASRQNALDDAMLHELHAALDAAERAPGCRMFVLQGTSGLFCTGMDLEAAAAERATDPTEERARCFQLLRRFTASPRVVVSIVDGRAEGGGVGLAAASDFVFATERARFGLPEALWGVLPSSVLPFLLRRTGVRVAFSMTLSTLPLDARKAEQAGLVDAVVDDPAVPLQRLAARITKLDPATIAAAKRSFTRLAPISYEVEAAALRELDELFGSPFVQRSLAELTGPRRSFPWER